MYERELKREPERERACISKYQIKLQREFERKLALSARVKFGDRCLGTLLEDTIGGHI